MSAALHGPVRVLVIGAGPATLHLHLPALARLRDHGEVLLSAICDIQQERAACAARSFGFAASSGDAHAALERNDIDAAYIFGSAQMHYEYALAALRHGKHVFVEKPIAPRYTDALEIARTARARGLLAVGGHNRRFNKSLAAVRATAGTMRWRNAEVVFHKPEHGKAVPYGASSWLTANGIHALDALLYMMGGMPDELIASPRGSASERGRAFSALMRWSDGAQAVFLCNNDAGSRREEYVFHGPGTTYTVGCEGLTIEKDGAAHRIAAPALGDGIAAEHEAFLLGMRGAATPAHAIEALAPALFIAELIEQGFAGRVRLPATLEASVTPLPRTHSILMVQPGAAVAAQAHLLADYRLVALEDVAAAQAQCADVVAAILGPKAAPLSAAVLDKLPSLRVIGIAALSLARFAPEALLARGITLLNASEAYAQSVAEFALALAIIGRRRAHVSHEIMRRGGWGTDRRSLGFRAQLRKALGRARPQLRALGLEPLLLRLARASGAAAQGRATSAATELRDALVGLIGWGANARAFAERLRACGARIIVYSEHATPEELAASGATAASLAEVLAAQIVSLHRGLTPSTRHALGACELDCLRPGSVLINVARGALIEPRALEARLQRGDIIACLDTFEEEPPATSDALRRLPNVFLTAHIAGGSVDMHAHAAAEIVAKVAAHLNGKPPPSVTAERLRTMT